MGFMVCRMERNVSGSGCHMADIHNASTGRGGDSALHPSAFDPQTHPELFEGVLARRIIAFFIDLVVLAIPVVLACIFILAFGIITLGFGLILFWLVSPASVVWALAYYGFTLGGPRAATVGMRVMDLEMRTWYGTPPYFLLGAVHGLLFWVAVSFFTPLIGILGLFNARGRLLHDFLTGVVLINNPARAAAYRAN